MRRTAVIVPAILLLASCAADDPPVAQTTTSAAVETSQATGPTHTTTLANQDAELETDDHMDNAGQVQSSEEHAGDTDHSNEPADGRLITVEMSEFSFSPPSIEVSGGETVTFMIKNTGLIEHEFRLSNAHRIEEHIASGHADHEEGAAAGHHDEAGDVVVLVAPGDSAQLTFQFPDDATIYTDVACLIPGHYEAGMHADLTPAG